MLKINDVIEVAPFATVPDFWKRGIVIDVSDYVTVEYMLGIDMRHFSFMHEGYRKDTQVRGYDDD